MLLRDLLIRSLVAGTLASLAMMPFGMLFRAAQMRVGHYGPKFAGLYLDDPGTLALFIQHLALGWISALPLIALLPHLRNLKQRLGAGTLYGALYYVAINSLALPLYFGDTLPWLLGPATVLPSLAVHLVFGLVVAWVGMPRQTA